MRNTNFYRLLLCSATMFINSGCTEDSLDKGSPPSTPPSVMAPPRPPTAFAGNNFYVTLPQDFCWLLGNFNQNGNIKVEKTTWKKLSGPTSYLLENPDYLRTKVSNLEKGIYEFELTIANMSGLTAKDTVKITVGEISKTPNEMIFREMKWTDPWVNTIEIKDFNLLFLNIVFKVYIQRNNNAQWIEVPFILQNTSTKYEYFVETRPSGAGMYSYNSLYILYYGTDIEDSPSVKIMY